MGSGDGIWGAELRNVAAVGVGAVMRRHEDVCKYNVQCWARGSLGLVFNDVMMDGGLIIGPCSCGGAHGLGSVYPWFFVDMGFSSSFFLSMKRGQCVHMGYT